MFNRYHSTEIKTDKKTKSRYFKPTLYPSIPEKDSDEIYTVRYGDRLDLLAHKFYDDVGLWWVISRANNLDPSDIGIKAASTLRIPIDISQILSDLKTINSGA
jgi:nucleoid-associated protein YgaU